MTMPRYLVLLAAVSTTPTVLADTRRVTRDVKSTVTSNKALIIGHRGLATTYPENTLPSFQAALEAEADLVELDYHHSADGIPVVIHDGTLDRTTDACQLWSDTKIKVDSRKLADLQTLDAGKWKSPRFLGTKIPTLVEALDLIQSGSITLIERKGGDAATCVRILREKDLLDQVVVQAFDWEFLTDCHALAPGLILGALGGGEITPELMEKAAASGAAVIGWNHKDLTEEGLKLAKAQGLRVWVYTVNDPVKAGDLVAMGVDGIISDSPDLMRQMLTNR